MWLRLRQIALIVPELEPAVHELCAPFDLKVGFRDPGFAHFGLVNALLPLIDAERLDFNTYISRNVTASQRYGARRCEGSIPCVCGKEASQAYRRRTRRLA
jgi:hypothetical protein